MNKMRLFKNTKFFCSVFSPRHYVLYSNVKLYSVYPCYNVIKSSYLNVSLKPAKWFSNCNSMQTKDSDSITIKNDSEKIQKVLEDEEFQNILKDFANDFGVDSETNELLDDIRKNINGDYEKGSISAERHNNSDNISATTLGGGLDHKYKEFSELDSAVIHSYEDDNNNEIRDKEPYHIDQELKPKSFYSNLERGITGVFDIGEMVQVLRNESLLDIATISMPTNSTDSSYDFFVIVTAKSRRHIEAVAESIKKLYKRKKNEDDPFIIVEGTNDSGWRVIDMSNIVLHIFLEETRAKYDIESCKLLDVNFDDGGNVESDPMLNIIEEQMEFFNSLQQSNSLEISKDIT